MDSFKESFIIAFNLILMGDSQLIEIVALSMKVSLIATLCASIIGILLGVALSILRFYGRTPLIILINGLMGLPPVVVGLLLYMLLSKNGPLNFLNILYSPSAMILAQFVIILPVVASLSQEILSGYFEEYKDQLRVLGRKNRSIAITLIWEGRFRLFTAVVAGLGRAVGEVGAVMIVGGNINHVTRVMTTSIALETSRGDLNLALALGMILVSVSIIINGALFYLRRLSEVLDGDA